MSNSNRILTERFKNTMINLLIDDIQEGNDYFYIFTGHSIPWANGDTTSATPSDDNHDSVIDVYQNMSFGKQLYANNLSIVIPRYDWITNTVYSMYNDQDPLLYTENFYVCVNSTATYDIFKCLYNNGGVSSTIQPIAADTSASEILYQTSDGYIWKWMYSIPVNQFELFATSAYIPVVENANITSNAIAGAIGIIVANTAGSGYGNYFEGQFNISDIQVGGNTVLYGIANSASTINNFYNQCLLYISDGTGKGQFNQITGYRVVGSIKEVILANTFSTTPDATSSYQIYPYVQVIGDDNVSQNCIARALINAYASNSVYQIQVIQQGAGYRIASASILSDPTVGVSNNANLQVIIPPPGGHGYDVFNELGGTNLGISLQFANNEGNTIPTQNGFRQVGIIRNPLFANVQLSITDTSNNPGSNGNFLNGEVIQQFIPITLSGNISVTSGNNIIIGTSTDFQNQLEANDSVYITAGTGQIFIGVVNNIINGTSVVVTTNVSFTNSNCKLALANIIATGVITNINSSSSLNITNATLFVVGDLICGCNSFAKANVASYEINGLTKTFETYVQLRRYFGSNTGVFIEGETVYQINVNSANANFFSINAASGGHYNFYVSNQVGLFSSSEPIIGTNSGATFTFSSNYPGDLVLDSGEILYYENDPVMNSSDFDVEVINIVLEYQ